MDLLSLFSLQGTLFAMILIGAWLKKRGVIDEDGKRCLTDLCIQIVIPCNTFKSCLIQFDMGIFQSCALLLLASVLMELGCLVLNRLLFRGYPPQRRRILQYCTLVPMSSFLGNPIAEGIYDQVGVLYAAVFLIPLRIATWSAGTSYFVADAHMDRKKILKNVATHPCLVAVYLGLLVMVAQIPLPSLVTETVRYIGSCNAALTMFIVGTILADVEPASLLDRHTASFCLLRLILLPAAALGLGLLLGLEPVPLGIAVLMIGMPAGSTAAIFAAQYHSDAPFATRCVIVSTLASMLTLPVWCWLVG